MNQNFSMDDYERRNGWLGGFDEFNVVMDAFISENQDFFKKNNVVDFLNKDALFMKRHKDFLKKYEEQLKLFSAFYQFIHKRDIGNLIESLVDESMDVSDEDFDLLELDPE